ncbi:plasmid stabilization protein [Methylobacterium sp. M6A4_1b]
MAQGDKSKYTDKQVRKAEHIAESYESRGVPEKEAEARAWATVNKDDGGGKKPGGSGRGKATDHPAAHRGGEVGGKASAGRTAEERSASAKKAAATRKRNAEAGRHAS